MALADFLLCVSNEGCDDLQLMKVYRPIPDPMSAKHGYVRVVDESGEDYIYPANCFLPFVVDVPEKIQPLLNRPHSSPSVAPMEVVQRNSRHYDNLEIGWSGELARHSQMLSWKGNKVPSH